MTIRVKLALNAGVVILVLSGIVVASTRGMRSVQSNIWALTQKSTPFQMKTLELEKAIQATVGPLGSANNARSSEELKTYRAQADRGLSDVRRGLDELKALSGGQGTELYTELSGTAKELIAAADSRLQAQEEAEAAGGAARGKLKEALSLLGTLDGRIAKLEKDARWQFQSSVDGIKGSSASLRDLEGLGASLSNLELLAFQILKAENQTALASLKTKTASKLEEASQNPYLTDSAWNPFQDPFQALMKKIQELLAVKGTLLAESGEASRKKVEGLTSEVDASVTAQAATISAELAKLKGSYEADMKRQDDAFRVLNAARLVTAGEMELVSLGRAMDSLSAHLLGATAASEVDGAESEIKRAFEQCRAVGEKLSGPLSQLQAKSEQALVTRAVGELRAIRDLIAGEGGIASKIRRNLELNDKARQMSKRLQETATRQTERGRQSAQLARGDQEMAIGAVNESLRANMAIVGWFGGGAVLFGLVFGYWIYRSISKPLAALSKVAADVERTGDFSLRSEARGRDEVALTVRAFNSLLDNVHRVIGEVNRVMADLANGDLRSEVRVEARGDLDSLKQSINASIAGLSRTMTAFRQQAQESSTASSESARSVDQVAASTRQQLDAVSRLAAAIQQTAATMGDISGNADAASSHSRGAAELVMAGRSKVGDMSRAMEAISANSEQIESITGMISDVADQTNLLALNAAIEAARAGEHGRGFAVVADEVNKLSERVAALTRDISSVIGSSVKESKLAAREAGEVRAEMEKIAAASGEIDDMLGRIATAIEEQSATVTAISGDVATLNEIAEGNAGASDRLASSLAKLAQLADVANRQVERFQT